MSDDSFQLHLFHQLPADRKDVLIPTAVQLLNSEWPRNENTRKVIFRIVV